MKKTAVPVVDLHSDLLSYLSHRQGRSPKDPISRSSYPQLMQGDVKLQTLAIFSKTGNGSVENASKQIDHFFKLIAHYPTMFAPFPLDAEQPIVHIIPAFENASAFASETEPLSDAIRRLESYVQAFGHLFYISLTWDEENRFGGGNRSTSGLKADGKQLVEWMHGKRIALDFSHTSDKLAYDLLNFIDQNRFDIPIIASHSNFRAISEYPRNLPDDLAKEIIRRKGLIGLNLFAPFIHKTDPFAIVRQAEYGLALGGEHALCFGADFFCDADFPDIVQKYQRSTPFYPEFSNASAYPTLLALFAEHLKLDEQQLHKIASHNALRFLTEKIMK